MRVRGLAASVTARPGSSRHAVPRITLPAAAPFKSLQVVVLRRLDHGGRSVQPKEFAFDAPQLRQAPAPLAAVVSLKRASSMTVRASAVCPASASHGRLGTGLSSLCAGWCVGK
jgi:hypothetical protein